MYPPDASSSPENGAKVLPLEIIWIIIKELLIDGLPITVCHKSKVDPSPILPSILTLNHHFHKLVIRATYHTIILSSFRLFRRFYHVASNSPHLTCLVHNLWIGTPHLNSFPDSKRCSPPTQVMLEFILSKTPRLQSLALPAVFAPHRFAELGNGIEHITIGGGSISSLPYSVKTVHIHGSIQPSVARYLKQGSVRCVVYDIERPSAPGAVGHIIHELMGTDVRKDDSGFRLEFVIHPRLSNWINNELSRVGLDGSSSEAFMVHIKDATCIVASFARRTYCDEWLGAIKGSGL
ncbi:hypothetical protein RhiXN_05129 [Rhizoctonia solani]|uniref:Uncharacterized protein n=1 Tax=Rhizoctonia solani TaxID=456999 RepID=A0A8H8SU92_9AGAM|nr:uncharacterized protein RhiXN_05129 [Rhizoctonia solani]QRW17127.1 hypothetical protein RhiXN_05129 [Rhizoctonia solani]